MDDLMIKILSDKYVGNDDIQLEFMNIPAIVGRFITTRKILLPENKKDLDIISFYYTDNKENIISFSHELVDYSEFLQMNIPKDMKKMSYCILIEYLNEIYETMKSMNLIDESNLQYKKRLF